MWFWERSEDQDNPSYQLNQLLHAINLSSYPQYLDALTDMHPFRSRMWEFCSSPIFWEKLITRM